MANLRIEVIDVDVSAAKPSIELKGRPFFCVLELYENKKVAHPIWKRKTALQYPVNNPIVFGERLFFKGHIFPEYWMKLILYKGKVAPSVIDAVAFELQNCLVNEPTNVAFNLRHGKGRVKLQLLASDPKVAVPGGGTVWMLAEKTRFSITMLEAKDIMIGDLNGFSDPYCELRIKGETYFQQTRVIPKTLNPKWNQQFMFHLKHPESDVLSIKLYDKDAFKTDDFLGEIELVCAAYFNHPVDEWKPWQQKIGPGIWKPTKGGVHFQIQYGDGVEKIVLGPSRPNSMQFLTKMNSKQDIFSMNLPPSRPISGQVVHHPPPQSRPTSTQLPPKVNSTSNQESPYKSMFSAEDASPNGSPNGSTDNYTGIWALPLICRVCKEESRPDAIFCWRCGTKFESSCPQCGKPLPQAHCEQCVWCGSYVTDQNSLETIPEPPPYPNNPTTSNSNYSSFQPSAEVLPKGSPPQMERRQRVNTLQIPFPNKPGAQKPATQNIQEIKYTQLPPPQSNTSGWTKGEYSAFKEMDLTPQMLSAPTRRPTNAAAVPPPQVTPTDLQPAVATVKFDFAAGTEDELTVKANDRVYVYNRFEDWIECQFVKGGQSGWVPANYLEIHENFSPAC